MHLTSFFNCSTDYYILVKIIIINGILPHKKGNETELYMITSQACFNKLLNVYSTHFMYTDKLWFILFSQMKREL